MPILHHSFSVWIWRFEITGFGIAVMLAFLGGQVIAQHEASRRGQDPDPIADVVFASVIGFLIGAKVYYLILTGDWDSLFSRAGLVYWGGFAGAFVAGALMSLYRRVPVNRMADVCAIGIGAGYSIGRTGCWAVGDDYGRPWNSHWAVAFTDGHPPSTAGEMQSTFGIPIPPGISPDTVMSVIPTQLIEVVLGFVMFLILWRLRKHAHAEGWLFGLYLVMAGIERFLVEFLRAKDDRILGGLTLAQAIAVVVVAAGVAWVAMRNRVREGAPGIYGSALHADPQAG